MNRWTILLILLVVFIGLTMWHQGIPKNSDDVTTAVKAEGKDFTKDTFDYLKNLVKKEEGNIVITTNSTNATGGLNG